MHMTFAIPDALILLEIITIKTIDGRMRNGRHKRAAIESVIVSLG
jgi:hypothetical protein